MTAPRSPWTPEHPDTPNTVPPPAPVARPQPQRADQDILIDRPELGPGATTLIVAGDVIPSELVHLLRVPRTPTPAPEPAHGKPAGKRGT